MKDTPGEYTIEELIDTRSSGGDLKRTAKSFTITENKLKEASAE